VVLWPDLLFGREGTLVDQPAYAAREWLSACATVLTCPSIVA
jgi:hypothetical protein